MGVPKGVGETVQPGILHTSPRLAIWKLLHLKHVEKCSFLMDLVEVSQAKTKKVIFPTCSRFSAGILQYERVMLLLGLLWEATRKAFLYNFQHQ